MAPSSVLRPSVASSLVILPLPSASLMVAPPDALLKVTEKVSAVSNVLSLDMDTTMDLDVSPAAKESVPEPAVKLVPEVAVPLLMAKSTVKAPVVLSLRVTVNIAVPADSLTVTSLMARAGNVLLTTAVVVKRVPALKKGSNPTGPSSGAKKKASNPNRPASGPTGSSARTALHEAMYRSGPGPYRAMHEALYRSGPGASGPASRATRSGASIAPPSVISAGG